MTALLAGLLGKLWPFITVAGGALVAFWQYGRAQKKAGVNEQKVKEAVAREQDINEVKAANHADDNVLSTDSVRDDPYNRLGTRSKG